MRYEMVPLSERLRYMQWFRLGLVAIVAFTRWLSPETTRVSLESGAIVLSSYLAVSGLCEVSWRFLRRRGLLLFGAMLLADGIFLAWTAYATGGTLSPLRYLVLVHLIMVTLLASYRTGLKLALWHTLLLFVVFHAEEAGLIKAVDLAYENLPGTDYQRLINFAIAFWLVGITTAAFSAVNERELRRRRVDLEALAHMASALEKVAKPDEVGEVLVRSMADTFGFERVVALGEPRGEPKLLAHHGTSQVEWLEPGVDAAVREAWDKRQTLLFGSLDPETNPRLTKLLPDARNIMITPLMAEDRPIGVLAAEHSLRQGSRIEQRVVEIVGQFAAHAALALDNAWLLERVQEQAETDGLTGVANRRTFEAVLDREVTRAFRNDDKLSLVMVDIDHFKALNDTYGHQKGDDVLRAVAKRLRRECRDFDTVSRYGGEEFAVILPGCNETDAMDIAERLREAVMEADTEISVSSSAGVATYPVHAAGPRGLIQAADGALYESKRSGRNRVTKASETTASETTVTDWATGQAPAPLPGNTGP
jgi:two-component system cell cycle response regulator